MGIKTWRAWGVRLGQCLFVIFFALLGGMVGGSGIFHRSPHDPLRQAILASGGTEPNAIVGGTRETLTGAVIGLAFAVAVIWVYRRWKHPRQRS